MSEYQVRAAFEAWYESAMWGNEDFKSSLRIAYTQGFQAALASPEVQALCKDAERLDWLEERTHDSSYTIQLRLLRDPAINSGMNRIEVRTGVGSGVWERSAEGHTLRQAIDRAAAEIGKETEKSHD